MTRDQTIKYLCFFFLIFQADIKVSDGDNIKLDKPKILLGTTNNHKIKEYLDSGMFEKFYIYTLKDFPSIPDIEETGKTVEENSALKAKYYFEKTGIPTISDDTGIFVHALGGFPGIYSARIAGPNKDFRKVKRDIAEKLKDSQDKRVTFSTALTYVDENNIITIQKDVYGTYVYGTLLSNPDLSGYRDAFLPDGAKKTIADMTSKEKKVFSARSKGLLELTDQLIQKGIWKN
ncbi:MAG: non-canonical purine NTP pyrophosphatase [Holosporales bacterium]|jgi:XTP/dITP diphosphohydrolase|nr:non-canonical purine NTP pyrophosphatase [Holosporales bacterium]